MGYLGNQKKRDSQFNVKVSCANSQVTQMLKDFVLFYLYGINFFLFILHCLSEGKLAPSHPKLMS